MKNQIIIAALFFTFNCFAGMNTEDASISEQPTAKTVIVIHGGAGWSQGASDEKQHAIKSGLKKALDTGFSILESGGSSLDAVEAAIVVLEDNPVFNAGRGSVYTAEEKQEMDASIMSGIDQDAGAVASISRVKNPIKLARYIMEHTEHVMMAGPGAEKIAEQGRLELVDPSYFYSENRLKRVKNKKPKRTARLEPWRLISWVILQQEHQRVA